jgi:hypothetical protein
MLRSIFLSLGVVTTLLAGSTSFAGDVYACIKDLHASTPGRIDTIEEECRAIDGDATLLSCTKEFFRWGYRLDTSRKMCQEFEGDSEIQNCLRRHLDSGAASNASTLMETFLPLCREEVRRSREEFREIEARPRVSSYRGINVGDFVVERSKVPSMKKVMAINSDGKFKLEDGLWYASQYIQAGVASLNGIRPGNVAIEIYGERSVQKVAFIAKNPEDQFGTFIMEGGKWFNEQDVIQALETDGEISVGQIVTETFREPSQQTVIAIAADKQVLLSDGVWYPRKFISARRIAETSKR